MSSSLYSITSFLYTLLYFISYACLATYFIQLRKRIMLLLIMAVILGFISLATSLAGIVLPNWLYLDKDGLKVHEGLWKECVKQPQAIDFVCNSFGVGSGTDVRLMHCISQLVNQKKACTCPVSLALNYTFEPKGVAKMWRRPMSRQQALPLALIVTTAMKATWALVLIGVIFISLALLSAILHLTVMKQRTVLPYASGILQMMAGICIIIGALMYFMRVRDEKDPTHRTRHLYSGWGVTMGGGGSAFIFGIFFFAAARKAITYDKK